MATISKRISSKGVVTYRAQIRIKKHGQAAVNESATFSTKTLAKEWAKKREAEIQQARIIAPAHRVQIKTLIERYIDKFANRYGRTKNHDLKRLLKYPLAELDISELTAKVLIAHCIERNKEAQPQTVKNDLTWLRVVIKTMKAVDGFDFDMTAFDDARTVLQKQRLISTPKRRNRRPTSAELWKLSRYFYKTRSQIPMLHIMWFAIYSTRRLSEITSLKWEDNNYKYKTGLVRDIKSPNGKGINERFKYTLSAWKIANRQPRINEHIFPYNAKTISTNFTRACKTLGIIDLHEHDLRHEGITRLFLAGYSIEQVCLFSLHRNWQSLKIYANLKPEDL